MRTEARKDLKRFKVKKKTETVKFPDFDYQRKIVLFIGLLLLLCHMSSSFVSTYRIN